MIDSISFQVCKVFDLADGIPIAHLELELLMFTLEIKNNTHS